VRGMVARISPKRIALVRLDIRACRVRDEGGQEVKTSLLFCARALIWGASFVLIAWLLGIYVEVWRLAAFAVAMDIIGDLLRAWKRSTDDAT
jgi:hypothetical protein